MRGFGGGEVLFERGEVGFVDAAVGKEVVQRGAVAAVLFLRGFVLAVQLVVLPALQLVARRLHLRLQGAPGFGGLGFLREFVALFAELVQAVVVAGEVLAHFVHPRFAFFAPRFVEGDARRFFDEGAQFFRLGFDDAADHALFDDGVAARANAGALQQFDDVAAADALAVDAVLRLAVALYFAGDVEFGVFGKCPARLAVAVVEVEGDARLCASAAVFGTGKDDVGHRLAAQLFGGGFAEYPAHGVDDVGFAAAVRADDAGQRRINGEGGVVGEGFESGEADGGEVHFWEWGWCEGRVL